MSKKSKKQNAHQKRIEQKRKKRTSKREKVLRQPDAVARQRDRIARQVPQAWPGELAVDVAVFDKAVLESLAAADASEVTAVSEAIELASNGQSVDAIRRVAGIPRRSQLSEWRLFVRGLVAWTDNDFETATRDWARLDAERRPGRIATALMVAKRDDLEAILLDAPVDAPLDAPVDAPVDAPLDAPLDAPVNAPVNAPVDAPLDAPLNKAKDGKSASCEWTDRLDKPLLHAAKLVRRVRFDRASIRVARRGVAVPEEVDELTIGPDKIRWLQNFSSEYKSTEPALVAALQQTAILRGHFQPFSDLFRELCEKFPGPLHDPHNSYQYFVFTRESDPDAADSSLKKYLSQDLPSVDALPAKLRAAIHGQICLNQARARIVRPVFGLSRVFMEDEDEALVERYFKQSIKAFPVNLEVHRDYTDWLDEKLDAYEVSAARRRSVEKRLLLAMKGWAKALPDDTRPRLWLINHLLDNELLEEAKPHIDYLSGTRQENPRIQAALWKWELLEAMRLCRRKTWLEKVPEQLDKVASIWPKWLPQDWLEYLRAAVVLRSGEIAKFHEIREKMKGDSAAASSLLDACMMLAAAQKMRVPAADLKPLRQPVEDASKNVKRLGFDELIGAGSFFWSLYKADLSYPAYRNHGSVFGREIWRRLRGSPQLYNSHKDDSRFDATLCWFSERRFWGDGYGFTIPPALDVAAREKPLVAAALINALLKSQYDEFPLTERALLIPLVLEAAKLERDPFYRYWFNSLAEEANESVARFNNLSGGAYRSLASPFDDDDEYEYEYDDDDDHDDDDFLGFNPDCNCETCQAAHKAWMARNGQTSPNASSNSSANKSSRASSKAESPSWLNWD